MNKQSKCNECACGGKGKDLQHHGRSICYTETNEPNVCDCSKDMDINNKPCSICQFEGGYHSQACSQYREKVWPSKDISKEICKICKDGGFTLPPPCPHQSTPMPPFEKGDKNTNMRVVRVSCPMCGLQAARMVDKIIKPKDWFKSNWHDCKGLKLKPEKGEWQDYLELGGEVIDFEGELRPNGIEKLKSFIAQALQDQKERIIKNMIDQKPKCLECGTDIDYEIGMVLLASDELKS